MTYPVLLTSNNTVRLAVSELGGKVGKYKLLDIVRYTECFKHTHSRIEDWTRYEENGIFCIMYDTVMYC